ncbi:MAG TPA: hypothetical protein VFL73_08745 [Solirubrobacteraceae bacterium]|nr:hypothetical protein [Solirubrobacteraceae bacterium]
MTFSSRIRKTIAIVVAIMVLGAPTAFATQMTYRERQAIASRGIGAPNPKRVAPGSAAQPRATSSGETDWAAIGAIAGVTAVIALLVIGRRRTPATPR